MKGFRYVIIMLILAIFLSSCKTSEKVSKLQHNDNLYRFFQQCENDLNQAARVVIDKDIVKNLSHLHRMNNGGRKYYILERENITSMINAVTKGIYSDYIILTRNGKVIYTKRNNDIFGLNAQSGELRSTPVGRCYFRSETIHIEDASRISQADSGYSYFISKGTSGKNSFPGVLILQIDARAMAAYLGKNTQGINRQGQVKISHNTSLLNSESSLASYINLNPSPEEMLRTHTMLSPKPLSYRYFNYRNINWVLITGN